MNRGRRSFSFGAPALTLFVMASLVQAARGQQPAGELVSQARAVLAQLDGEIRLSGLTAPVEVLRDRWGVPHIYAENQDDLFFAQGFVAAQDRLFQIDLWRRIAVGETAEVFGPGSLVRDRFARLTRYRGDMDAEWQSYAPDARRIATAFTRGINACIDHLGQRIPIEFKHLGYRPAQWQPEDCLGRMSVLPVAFNLRREIARAELVAAVGPEAAERIMPTDPPLSLAQPAGLDLAGIDRQVLAGYSAVTAGVDFGAGDAAGAPGGSNNWAVDGSLSASGKPLLAGDPHRALALPSLRYMVHLNAPGWNVIGSGEPALPGVAIGHNERIAWAFTVVLTDQADVFVEQTHPDDARRYRVGDGWEPMQVIRETVAVRGAAPVELELCFTRHGPVIHEDRPRNRAVALRWVGSEPGTAAYLASLAIDRAGNWEEFRAAAARWKAPSENLMYADVDGNIGWIAAALTPVRQGGWQGVLPVPGWTGQYRWSRFLSIDELPQALNPPRHWLATANHKILPPDYPHEIAYDWTADYRYRRIESHLSAGRSLSLDDMRRMQFDNVEIPGRQLVGLLGQVRLADASLEPYASLMAAWDGAMGRQSQAGPLYAHWLRELLDGFFAPHVPKELLESVSERQGVQVMLAALERPTAAWFGEEPQAARDRLLVESLASAVEKTRRALGDDAAAWRWGRLHQVLFNHPLAARDAAFAAFNVGPLGVGGGPFSPDQAVYTRSFRRTNGASYRQVFDLADWDRGQATSAPGQSGQPGSPHYADLAEGWAGGEYFPLAFSRESVERVTRHRLRLAPANR